MSLVENTRVGRFASKEIRNDSEWPICKAVVGLRFERIEIRLTRRDYADPHVQEWIQRLFTRSHYIDHTPLIITVMI